MIHPPTHTHGPLQDQELVELTELLDDLDAFVADNRDQLPEDLVIRIPFWAWRLANAKDRP